MARLPQTESEQIMANERDNAFTSTGLGGIDQGTDFDTGLPGTAGTNRTMNTSDGAGQPMTARAKEAASTAGHKAVERVQERLADQVSRATGQLESVASSLRTAGAQMPADNGIGRYMVQAATQVDNLASFLNNREVGELVDEVEDFARRQPAVFIGGAFALGVLGARFLRSSRQNMGLDSGRDYRRRTFEGGYGDDMSSRSDSTYGRSDDGSRTGYGTGYSAGSTPEGSDLSSGGFSSGSLPSDGGYTSSSRGGTTGNTGLGSSGLGSTSGISSSSGLGSTSGPGSSSGLGSASSSRDLASDVPSGTRGLGSSNEGMTGSSTSRPGGFGSGASTSGIDRGTSSLADEADTGTTGYRNDSLSGRSDSGTDRGSLDSGTNQKSPDFL